MSKFQYFSPSELACRCGCGGGEADMAPIFMRRIVELRKKCNFPFIVSSAYRCPDYNEKVSATGRIGPHTTGHALDIRIYGERAALLQGIARQYGMTGLGVSQKGEHAKRFLHLDDITSLDSHIGPRPWIWSY